MVVIVSHVVNILVAGFLGVVLFGNISSKMGVLGQRLEVIYGGETNARKILSCMYLAIAILSVLSLSINNFLLLVSVPLFGMQIIYKVLTLFSVGTIRHPVVFANLVISVLHAVSIAVLLQ